jgi:hypothetical protein
MAKGSNYFSHDYNARADEKIKLLIRKWGMQGYGVYWSIIEDLYQNANAMQLDSDGIAYDLRVDENMVKSILNDFDLFVVNGECFGSNSVEKRMKSREDKSKRLAENARKRWDEKQKQSNADAIAMQEESKSKALYKKKVKEIKVERESGDKSPTLAKDFEARKRCFKETLRPHLQDYGADMLKDFYEYWTEPNKSGTKFRQEMEKAWDLKRRLRTWASRERISTPDESKRRALA